MKRHLLPCLAAALLAGGAGCQRQAPPPAGAAPTVAVSTNLIRIGDPLQVRLTAVYPTNLHLTPPELAQGKDVIVRNRTETAVPLPDGRRRAEVDYTITSLVTGNHILAQSPGLVWTRPDGTTTQVPFPFVAFKVQSMLAGTNADRGQIRDLHELARWPDRFPRWLLGLLLAAAGAGLAAGLLRYALARARARAAQAPAIPPHEAALAALRALLARGLIEQNQVEPFYVEVSAIARRYLEARFRLHAPEQTTEEFLRDAASAGQLSPVHQQLVAAFLAQSDLVKFARFLPGAGDMRAACAAAEKLVRETMPAAPDSPPAGGHP